MYSYNSSTPIGDWSKCTRCRLHSTRGHVTTRRSGLANTTITFLRIDSPPFSQEQRHVCYQSLSGIHPNNPSLDGSPRKPQQELLQTIRPPQSPIGHTNGDDRVPPTENNSSERPTGTPSNTNREHDPCSQTSSIQDHIPRIPFILFILPKPTALNRLFQAILKEASSPHPNYKFLPPISASPNPYPEHLYHQYEPKPFFFTVTSLVSCLPIHTPETTPKVKIHGLERDPVPAEIQLCQPHINELLSSYNYTNIITFGDLTLSQYPKSVNLPDLEKLENQNYLLLPIIKAGYKLRCSLT